MSIAIVSANDESIVADIDGVRSFIPRSMRNAEFQRFFEIGMKEVERAPNVYNAFPSAIFQKGNSLAAIFSSGEGHGNSQRQIAIRSDDEFETVQRYVFRENSAPNTYDLTFLDGMLDLYEIALFKNIFKVRRTETGYETKFQSTTVVTGQGSNNGTYSFWSAKPIRRDGKLLCTGYRTSGPYTITALFESDNDGWDWSFSSIIAADPTKAFSEAAIVECANGDLLAVIREDIGSGRPLYITRCSVGHVDWLTPSLLTDMEGVQPCLHRMPDGDIVLMVGHRTGTSGLDVSGRLNDRARITGVVAWRSANHGVTWPNRINLAPMWSTDGGQPMAVNLPTGRTGALCYLAPAVTTGDSGVEPGIYWLNFKGSSIV